MAESSGRQTILFLGIAIGLGVVAAVLAGLYLKSREAAIRASLERPEQAMVRVVVAKEDLPKGLRVTGRYFAVRAVPEEYVHPNAIRPADFDSVQGRFLVADLAAGRPLLTTFLNETFPVDFSDTVARGRRAMTVQVDEVNSVAGLIRPGNRVDIFVNIDTRSLGLGGGGLVETALANPAAGATATTGNLILPVLQGVRVLATGSSTYDQTLDELMRPQRAPERRFTNLTLDVEPRQAALLAAAEDRGDLVALLRNRGDETFAEFTGVSAADLYAHARRMQAQAALRKAASAAGATIDEDGNLVMPDGTVVDASKVRVGPDGTISSADGSLVVGPDGKVTSKAELLEQAGYTRNADGTWTGPDGKVVAEDDIQVMANGSVVGPDGQVIAGPEVTRTKDGFYVTADGRVLNASGEEVVGARVDADGNVIAADGTQLTDPNVTAGPDGSIRNAAGQLLAAARQAVGAETFDRLADEYLKQDSGGAAQGAGHERIDIIVGGKGKDGVATVSELPVLE